MCGPQEEIFKLKLKHVRKILHESFFFNPEYKTMLISLQKLDYLFYLENFEMCLQF